jgi:hypothetical protein
MTKSKTNSQIEPLPLPLILVHIPVILLLIHRFSALILFEEYSIAKQNRMNLKFNEEILFLLEDIHCFASLLFQVDQKMMLLVHHILSAILQFVGEDNPSLHSNVVARMR